MVNIVTIIGLQITALFSAVVVVEIVFAWPGLGLLMIEAIQQRDYPVVQAAVLCISVTYIFINLLTDLLYAWLDPRINWESPS